MCTAVTYQTKQFYFGRTLDYEYSYGEEVTITPRNFPLSFPSIGEKKHHYAIIGMAHVAANTPLYYDGMNEKGLCMAGLNFTGNAVYNRERSKKKKIPSFALIPWILGMCSSVQEAKDFLADCTVLDLPFSSTLPSAELHWILADRKETVTVETVEAGLMLYENPIGVLTNNPPFPQQLFGLNNYRHLSPKDPPNTFSHQLPLPIYSRGMGGLGLPGDLSSPSRFIRGAFTKLNARSGDSEAESISQFFHILGAVEQSRGCCEVANGQFEITRYTSCCNADQGIYYYTTYENHQITAVDLHREALEGQQLIRYPLIRTQQIHWQNGI